LALAEKQIRYESVLLDLRAGESHTPEYLKLNPKGVVPTLVDNGVPVVESTVINEFLEDKYPERPLSFGNPENNARMRNWVMHTDAGLLNVCAHVSFGIAFKNQEQSRQLAGKPEAERQAHEERNRLGLEHPEVRESLIKYNALLDKVETTLNGSDWLAGDKFSLAECAILPYIKRLEDLALAWLWEDSSERTSLAEWYSRCKDRLSFKLAISDFFPEPKREMMYEAGRINTDKVKRILSNSALS
jgi:glutathione S-transferase